jgi:AcrR family transcriptional regulator
MPIATARHSRPATRPAPVPRRTQEERRTTTRLGLLDAAIECLVDAGYSGLTTTEVCRRAGVSQGALFKHFATKAELVAATAEHLFANLIDTFRAGLPPLDATTDRPAVVVQQLWTVFQQPRLEAAFELYVAARTDADLARRLAPVSERHSENMRRLAHELFPEAAYDAGFDAFVDLGISALQGAAIGRPLRRDDDAVHAPMLAVLTDFLRQIVETPSSRVASQRRAARS